MLNRCRDIFLLLSLLLVFLGCFHEKYNYLFISVFFFVISFLFFDRGNKRTSILFLVWSFVFLIYSKSAFIIISNLGVDSFSEVWNFDIEEAKDWIASISSAFSINFNSDKFILVFIVSFIVFFLGRGFFEKNHKPSVLILFFLAIISIFTLFLSSFQVMLESHKHLHLVKKNFSQEKLEKVHAANELNLVVYIGESTTSMNMGVYGYPRNTTPKLEALKKGDEGILFFENVFSTHSHTAPSLLEALSFAESDEKEIKTIYERTRRSVVDVIKDAGLNVSLYSNQGESGSWNIASKTIFANASSEFSTNSKFIGNNDDELEKPFDYDYFSKVDFSGSGVYFLHSYAGHGDYLKNIPSDFHGKVDGFFEGLNSRAVLGELDFDISHVESYDSAVKYIDFSVSSVIDRLKADDKPVVFVYFSDHGEAPYGKRGHDSSRFTHEMLRVPLIIYFNDSAIEMYPQLFEKYKNIASEENIIYLSQISGFLVDILGINYINKFSEDRVMVRKLRDGYDFFSLSNFDYPRGGAINEVFAARNYMENDDVVCYHRSNSIGSVLRGRLVANCLEIDIVIDGDGAFVYHPPKENNGLLLGKILHSVLNSKEKVWLDVKNMNSLNNCEKFSKVLRVGEGFRSNTFVELSPGSFNLKDEMGECVAEMRKGGVVFSHYMRDYSGLCEAEGVCKPLVDDLIDIEKSEMFDQISFDFKQFHFIKNSELVKKIKMNTWGVSLDEYKDVKHYFERIIFYNDDLNKY